MHMLDELAGLGMRLARLVTVRAEQEEAARGVAVPAAAPAEPAAAAELDADDPDLSNLPSEPRNTLPTAVLALQRVARTVRLCMALSHKLYYDRLERERKTAADYAVAEQTRTARRKQQIERVVKQAIDREIARREPECASKDERLGLYDLDRELSERLDEEDIERDLGRCPTGELVGRVCRDIGIEPDWDLWRTDHWAVEEARLKPPGSPYAVPPEPEEPKPETAKPPEPEPEAAKPPEPEPEAAKPEAPAAQPTRSLARTPTLTPEQKRAADERAAYIRSKIYNGL
jgi:hypothetical protein